MTANISRANLRSIDPDGAQADDLPPLPQPLAPHGSRLGNARSAGRAWRCRMSSILAAAKAVAFAEDALYDTQIEDAFPGTGQAERDEVISAVYQVRRIASAGTPAVEAA